MKEPVILLPGLLCDDHLWRHQIQALSEVAEVRVPDLTQDASLPAMAERVLQDAPERFSLCGLSMGGYLSFEIMRQAPERVRRLALVDTSARADTPEQADMRRDFLAMAEQGDFEAILDSFLPKLVAGARSADPALMGPIREMARRVGREAYIRQQTAIRARPDSRPDLANYDLPVLVLCGREDGLTPLEVHGEMAAEIPGAAFVVIDDCGHLSPLEQPHAVTTALSYWLQI